MRFFRLPVWAWLGVFTLCVSARLVSGASANVIMEDDARASIQLTPVTEHWDGIGFLAVAVKIENESAEPRRWDLDFTSGGVYGYGRRASFPVTFTVPPRSVRESVIYVPGAGSGGNRYSSQVLVLARGPGVRSTGGLSLVDGHTIREQSIAISARLERVARDTVDGSSSRSGRSSTVAVEVVDPARWPADWRVWSAFGRLHFQENEFAALDGARRQALLDWAAQGGDLRLFSAANDSTSSEFHGVGSVVRSIATFNDRHVVDALSAGASRGAPWADFGRLLTETDRNDLELVRDAVWIIPFLIVFGLLVGPINVFVFAPASRRQRLFFTVPLLSLAASLLISAFIVLRDGFGGEGTRRAFVVLVAGENKAVVFQQQVARTGVLTGDSFPLALDTIAVDEADTSREVARDLVRRGDTASGDWFESRARQSLNLRRITPTRARVELVAGGEGGVAPVVQSTFTTVLKDFVYLDRDGTAWSAFEVRPGERVELQRRPPEITLTRHVIPNKPGRFYALGGPTDLAPIATLDAIKWSSESIIYIGQLERGGRP